MGILGNLRKKDQTDAPAKDAVVSTLVAKDSEDVAPVLEMKKSDNKKYNVKEYAVFLRPIVTEKSVLTGTYLFEVIQDVNKVEIKKAFYNIYGIMPKKVNVVVQLGKKVRTGRVEGKRKDWKKAIIILKKGDKIDTF